jgi:hypothetical protein
MQLKKKKESILSKILCMFVIKFLFNKNLLNFQSVKYNIGLIIIGLVPYTLTITSLFINKYIINDTIFKLLRLYIY